MIIYDPELQDATIEAGTTIAGQTDGLVLSPDLAAELKESNFSVLVDFRDLKFKDNISCHKWRRFDFLAICLKRMG
ncbi:hypothetical protein CLV98_101542 [Dyadobacter jejuensis]|uniref:Uncharacterized protein n=1 Tax=Dyadobacter jejuensis TaxID=1082580 RepID=A0A316AUJ5_9BACT|nr:hypothetical protein CLV98_101542 [Dyadobacter jejuensis]